jgi:hypothetical protein
LYLPPNPRPHKAYGFGAVEQIVMTGNIALRHQVMQLQHFTEGNVPPGLLNAPDGWSAEQIRQFQEWFDGVLAGNTGGRSRLMWGPSGTKYEPFKEAPYKDEFDEWLARIVCYCLFAAADRGYPASKPGDGAVRPGDGSRRGAGAIGGLG